MNCDMNIPRNYARLVRRRHLTWHRLTWAGARERYPGGVPAKVGQLIERELAIIDELNYAAYFLTVWDLVRFARAPEILCQGRGSAANSAVCYCLGVTSVDPDRIDVLFERFISKDRDEAPDIDIDFEHQRREEVIQYIYEKYGRERAGMTAELITYRPRSAVRDVGKALGLSLDRVDALAKAIGHASEGDELHLRFREAGLDPTSRLGRQLVHLVARDPGLSPPPLATRRRHGPDQPAAVRDWCRSKTPACPAAPSCNGTRTTWTHSASSRSIAWRSGCSRPSGAAWICSRNTRVNR